MLVPMKRWFLGIVAFALAGATPASLVHDWTKQFDGASSSFDGRDKLVGDTSGNAYFVHEPVKPATNSRDVTLTKFAPGGTVAWERTLPRPFLVAFDLDGEEVWHDAFIPGVGSIVGVQSHGSTTIAQTHVSDEGPNLLLKYGPTGSIIWRSRFNPIHGARPIAGHGESGGAFVAMNNPRAWGAVRVRYTSHVITINP